MKEKEFVEDESLENESFITIDGKNIPIEILLEFDREENNKEFVFYRQISEKDNDDELCEFNVAEIKTLEDGSQELFEVDNEDDMAFCEEKFNELVEEMESYNLDAIEEEEEN